MKILKLLMKDQDVGTVIVAVIVTTNVQKTFCSPLMLSCSLEKILLARNLQHLWRKHQTFFFLVSSLSMWQFLSSVFFLRIKQVEMTKAFSFVACQTSFKHHVYHCQVVHTLRPGAQRYLVNVNIRSHAEIKDLSTY